MCFYIADLEGPADALFSDAPFRHTKPIRLKWRPRLSSEQSWPVISRW